MKVRNGLLSYYNPCVFSDLVVYSYLEGNLLSIHYAQHREKQLEYAKEHREARRITSKKWRDAQREAARKELGIQCESSTQKGKILKLTWRYLGLSTRRQRKEYLVNRLGGKCELCGYNKELTALHFDHKDPKEKQANIASLLDGPLEMAAIEARKCRILCANCHAEKTSTSKEWGRKNLGHIYVPAKAI